ncbi:MAG: serine/threonine-protein kinase [Pseudomonadota bacterium]
MENFKDAFEAFLRNELERDELALQLEQWSKQTPGLSTEIESYLSELYQAKRLSEEDYSAFNSLIGHEKTRIATAPRRTSPHKPRSDWSHQKSGSWSRPSQWEDSDEIELKPGLVIRDNYRLEEELGEGGMGVVWKAIDLIQEAGEARDSHVAIKFFSRDFKQHPDALKALVREFHRYKRLTHPKIVKAHGLDRFGNTYFMVMELLKGIPLNEFLKSHKNGVSIIEAKPIIKDMAEALGHAHQEGIAHLDFKPANVFYDPDEKIAKVIDFGIARPLEQSERDETLFDPGTLQALTDAYASYEMLLALEPDQRDDIYGLACVTYELLSGKHPFNRKKATTAEYEKLSPKPIKGLNNQQNQALLRALAFYRDERTLTASQFLAELFPPVKESPNWFLVGGSVIVLGLASFAAWEHFKPQPTPEGIINEPAPSVVIPEPPQVTPTPLVDQEPAVLEPEEDDARQQAEAALAEERRQQEEARQQAEAALAEEQRQQEEARQQAEAARLAEEQRQQVAGLLRECQRHLEANRLTTGSGGTALACYRKVLALDADNADAKEGLREIERRYQYWAEGAFRRNDLPKVRKYLKRIEMVDPQSPILAELRERLENER